MCARVEGVHTLIFWVKGTRTRFKNHIHTESSPHVSGIARTSVTETESPVVEIL